MNDNNHRTINTQARIIRDSRTTVRDYIKLLLMLEGKVNETDPRIEKEESIWKENANSVLDSIANDQNITAFLLSLQKKNKKIAQYYISLIQKYELPATTSKPDNKGNIYKVVEKLLDEASIITHPDNQIDKYFLGQSYSFAVGVRLEEYYKFIPDRSIMKQVQETMRRRVAFLMTLIQLRTTGEYGFLKDIFFKKGIYTRELSLNILYHSIVSFHDLIKSGENLNTSAISLLAQYGEVKRLVKADIKQGRLSLPERRVFKLFSPRKKRYLRKEFKKIFIDEKDFTKNNLLKIISAYRDNYNKIEDQVFPVAVVKDPITGKILRVELTNRGVQSKPLKEVIIPNLSIISDDDVENYIKKRLANALADNPDLSINEAVKETLSEKHLDSDTTVRNVSDIVKTSVYSAETLSRKLLFFLEDFNPDRTVAGNLVSSAISHSLLPSSLKENVERVTNIPGPAIFATVASFAFLGLPAALVISGGMGGYYYLRNKQSPEKQMAVGFLKGLTTVSDKDLETMLLARKDPYFEMMKLLITGNNSISKAFKNIFASSDERPEFSKFIGNYFIQVDNNVSKTGNIIVDIFNIILGRVGINRQFVNSVRKTGESVETIKNLLSSSLNSDKREEAFDVISFIANHLGVFGFFRSFFARNALNILQARDSAIKGFKNLLNPKLLLGNILVPNSQKVGGESFLYSIVGRTIQKTTINIFDTLGSMVKKDGGAFINRMSVGVGDVANKATTAVFGPRYNMVNNATFAFTGLLGCLAVIALGTTIIVSPLLISTRTALGVSSSLSTSSSSGGATIVAPFNMSLSVTKFEGSPTAKISYKFNLNRNSGYSTLNQVQAGGTLSASFTPSSIQALIANNFGEENLNVAAFLNSSNNLIAQATTTSPAVSAGWTNNTKTIDVSADGSVEFNVDTKLTNADFQNIAKDGFCTSITLKYTENNISKFQSTPNSCVDKNGKEIITSSGSYTCPLKGNIVCTQGPRGTISGGVPTFHYTDFNNGLRDMDLSASSDNIAYAVESGKLVYGTTLCDGSRQLILTATNGRYTYTYLHTRPTIADGDTVQGGQELGKLILGPINCPGGIQLSSGTHLHIVLYDLVAKKYMNPQLKAKKGGEWNCGIQSDSINYCSSGNYTEEY